MEGGNVDHLLMEEALTAHLFCAAAPSLNII